jgi:hypothetical protein
MQINLPGLVSIFHRMRFVDGKQEYSGCTVLLLDYNIAATADDVPKALAKAQDRLSRQPRTKEATQ